MKIKTISNNRLTLLRKLNQKKYRQQEHLFLVEGVRAVQQVLGNKQIEIEGLFFDEAQEYWKQPEWRQILHETPASFIESKTYAGISDTDNPQGVLAMCRMPDEIEPEAMGQHSGLIIATDELQDPGNLGTIIRTASWFGVAGLLSGKGTVDLFHPKVVRSTAGAIGTVPHANVELEKTLPVFEQAGWSVVMLDSGSDSMPLQQIKRQEKMVIVVGNEARGVNKSLIESSREKARIESPRKGKKVESLNAAVAVSIALFALS